jgi:subtilisin family serine protease
MSMDELKQAFAENLTKHHNATVYYVGRTFPTIHIEALSNEILDVSNYDVVKHIDVDGDFFKFHLCLDVSVPTIRADRKADLPYDGSGIKIAVLDSGINKTHPDLDDLDDDPLTNDPKVILEEDFTGENTTLDIGSGDGTKVAGIMAGTGNASSGMYRGVAPKAWLLNGRIAGPSCPIEGARIHTAIDWAVSNGADVISLSVGTVSWIGGIPMPGSDLDPASIAANEAVTHGVVVVASAGNKDEQYNRWGLIETPGAASQAITVGSSDDVNTETLQEDILCEDSAHGPTRENQTKPDVVAPGGNITSTNPSFASGDYYTCCHGTSASTPHVAGVAALILQAHPGWTPAMVKSAIMSTAVLNDNLQSLSENWRGKGIVDAKRALNCAIDVPTSNPDFNQTGGYGWHSEQVFENGTIKTLATSATFWPSLSTANATKLFNLASTVTRPTFTYGFHEICYYLVFSGWCQVNATLKLSNSTGHVLFSHEQQIEQLQLGTWTVDRFYQISCTYDGLIGALGSPYSVEFGFSTWASADIVGPSTASVTVHSLSVSIMGVQGLANPSFEERLNSVYVPACWLGNTSGWRELKGDINGDGHCGYVDQGILLAAYGSHKGDTKYNWKADLNGNGHVNYADLGILLADYGNDSTTVYGPYSWCVSSVGSFSMYQWMCDKDAASMRGKLVHFGFWLRPTGQYNTSIEVFYVHSGGNNIVTSSNYISLLDWRYFYINLELPETTTAVKITIRDNTPNLKARIDEAHITIT